MKDESILKALEQDARQIAERMPMNMGSETVKDVAAMLQKFIAANNLSQKKIGQMLGVSTTQINQFLHGKYAGDVEQLINKIVHLVNLAAQRQRHHKREGVVDTTVALRIATLIKNTEGFSDEHEGKIGLIIGDAGHGKSVCMAEYARSNLNSVYVELDDTMSSTVLFGEICKSLRLDSFGLLSGLTNRLIRYLENRQMTVMLDEAAGLSVKQLNQLRQIIVVKARCPLILAGNRDLLKTVMTPTTRRGCESLDQFQSRLMAVLDLDRAAGEKGDGGLYTAADIRKLYEYGGVRLTGDAVDGLRKICRTPFSGRLRTCGLIVAALHLTGRVRKAKVITGEQIVALIEQLDLPVKVRLPLATGRFEETHEQAEAKAG